MSDNPFNDNPFAVGTSAVRFLLSEQSNHFICFYAFSRIGEQKGVEHRGAICGCRRVLPPNISICSDYMLRVITFYFRRLVMEQIQRSPHQPGEEGRLARGAHPTRCQRPRRCHRPHLIPPRPLSVSRVVDRGRRRNWIDAKQS